MSYSKRNRILKAQTHDLVVLSSELPEQKLNSLAVYILILATVSVLRLTLDYILAQVTSAEHSENSKAFTCISAVAVGPLFGTKLFHCNIYM